MIALDPTAITVEEHREAYPATGVIVEIYLDGIAKPKNFDRFIMEQMWIGLAGLIERSSPSKHGLRMVRLDAADLPELVDALMEALHQQRRLDGKEKMAGPQVSLVAMLNQVAELERRHRI